ncbi:MAG: energy transducer TonB [Vicinamibacterales bacterium]
MMRLPLALAAWHLTLGLAIAQPAVEPVRALYLAADYEGALAALDAVRAGDDGEARLAADRLRAFCLLALDRPDEADTVIARIVTTHPAYEPGTEVSPRIRMAFRAQRDRLLPAMARRLYDEGRSAFDRGYYADAVRRFEGAMPVLEALALEGRTGMEDLRVLTKGFLELGRARVPPPPPEPLAAESWPVPAMTAAADAATDPALEVPPTQPVAIKQDLPPWNASVTPGIDELTGAVEVRIDDTGRVTDARIVSSVNPFYDRELLRAARDWRYEPARRAGAPVSSHKRVEVVLRLR